MNHRIIENAHKITFLIQQYPDHTVPKIIDLLAMPAVEINSAMWYAQEQGWLGELDKEANKISFVKAPEQWQFGDDIEALTDMIVYSFTQLAKKEQDLDEVYVDNWTHGYAPHDKLVALKKLLNDRVLATYELTDPRDLKSTYTFYTLYENSEQMWGRKQFPEQPTGAEVPETDNPNTGDAGESEK